jgi:hypothetical protein
MGSGLLSGLGLGGMSLGPGMSMPGVGGPSQDMFFANNGRINKLDKGVAGGGKTSESQVTGERREDGKGEETYIEIKGPTSVGNRSSVPYKSVLPSYRKKAEQAIDRQKIPKQHEKRVKEYFDSLNGGKG